MRLKRPAIPAVLLLSVMLPSGAHAEPVQITSGFLRDVGPLGGGTFEFNGADFFASGLADDAIINPETTCWACAPGNTISMSAYYFAPISNLATATVAGTTYDRIYLNGQLTFESADVTAPSMTPNGFTVSQPFTLSGYLVGELSQASGPAVFRQALTGHGTVTASFSSGPLIPGGTRLFAFETMRYEFAPGAVPDPVPEPATFLLFGSGVGAALFRKRVKRRLE